MASTPMCKTTTGGAGYCKNFTGVDGYTNLECYLNELSDKLVGQSSIVVLPPTTTITGIELTANDRISATISPNPTETGISIKITGQVATPWRFEMVDTLGRVLTQENNITTPEKSILLPRLLAAGAYYVRIYLDSQTFQQRVVVVK